MDTHSIQTESFVIKYKIIIFAVLLTATTFGIYSRVITYDFVNFDDDNYVTGNAMVKKGISLEGLKYAFSITEEKRAYWHPVTWLSHMMDCQVFGLNAGMHHLSNLLLHILTSLLLLIVFHSMTGAFIQSALITTLFAIHPLSVDSVAWIAERKNVLSTFFWMLTMLAYITYSKKPGIVRYLIFFSVFMLGLLAKPMLVTLPFVLLIMDFWPMNRIQRAPLPSTGSTFFQTTALKLILEKVPLIATSLMAIFISSYSLKVLGVYLATIHRPMAIRIENALVSYVKYIGKIIWPDNLAVFYPFPSSIPAWKVISATIVLVAISALVIKQLKSRPWLAVGWFWFLGTLFPVSGLVQGGLWPEMADRWAYIPQIGIFIMITWQVTEFADSSKNQGKFILITTGALIIALCAMTWTQAGYWKNSKVLFYHALSVTGENAIVYRNLGQAYLKEKNYDRAIEHFRKAIKLNPGYSEVHIGLGNALLEKKETKAALQHYKAAIKLKPKEPYTYVQIGILLRDEGHPKKALKHLNQALELYPESVAARHNLGLCLAELGDFEAGEKEVLKALEMSPGDGVGFYNAGAFYGKYGNQELAKKYLEKALADNPEHPEANYNLGIIAAGQNNTVEAEKFFLKTLIGNPEHINARNNLGLLYSKTGQFNKAIQQFEKALKVDPRDTLVRFNLADAMLMVGQIPEAIGQFTKTLEIDPDHEGAHLGLTEAQRHQDTIDSEIASTETLLKIDPESPTLLVTMGDLYLNRGDPQKALEYYLKLYKRFPKHPGVLSKSAATYARLADYEKAIAFFKDIVTLTPEKPEGYYNVACMYSRLNKTSQALKWLRKAIAKGYSKWNNLKFDEDLENVRNTPGFKDLMGEH